METSQVDNSIKMWQEFIRKGEHINKLKSAKRKHTALLKLNNEWQAWATQWLANEVRFGDVVDVFTSLDEMSHGDADAYLQDFCETLMCYTDRMNYRRWLRCQLLLANALNHSYVNDTKVSE